MGHRHPDESQGVTTDKALKYLPDFVNEMKKALALSFTQTQGKPVAFFLTSDDPKVKEKIRAVPELAGRIFTWDEPVDRSTIKGQQNALVDWYLLGATNFIIGTYQSTFSEEAAHLTKEQRKINVGETAYRGS